MEGSSSRKEIEKQTRIALKNKLFVFQGPNGEQSNGGGQELGDAQDLLKIDPAQHMANPEGLSPPQFGKLSLDK